MQSEIDVTLVLILKSMQNLTISDELELNLWKDLGLANDAMFFGILVHNVEQ